MMCYSRRNVGERLANGNVADYVRRMANMIILLLILAIRQYVRGVALKKAKEQKVKNSPDQKRGRIVRRTKTDVTHMKTAVPQPASFHLIHQKNNSFLYRSPVLGTDYLKFEWFVPKTGLRF